MSLKTPLGLVLGLAYKPDVADPRESPAFEVIERLLESGARVSYHDPLIPAAPRMRTWAELPQMRSEPLTSEVLAAQDAVLLITDHAQVDYDLTERWTLTAGYRTVEGGAGTEEVYNCAWFHSAVVSGKRATSRATPSSRVTAASQPRSAWAASRSVRALSSLSCKPASKPA